MRGAVFARQNNCFERYVDEVYRHMWCDPKKMDEADVIAMKIEPFDGVNWEAARLPDSQDI